jgi:hypothetical protein
LIVVPTSPTAESRQLNGKKNVSTDRLAEQRGVLRVDTKPKATGTFGIS